MMTRRTAKQTACIALMAAFAMMAAPLASATEKGQTELVAVSHYIVGNQVLVKVANPGDSQATGSVEVEARTVGVPVRSASTVSLRPGETAVVAVSFALPVSEVEGVWISDGADPVL